jgi:hypothetical protein
MTLKEAQELAQARTDRQMRMAGRIEWNAADSQFYAEHIERLHPLDNDSTKGYIQP